MSTEKLVPCDRVHHSSVGVTVRVLRQQQSRHATCSQCSTPMTCLNQQVHVAAQETLLHVYVLAAVRQQEGPSVTCRRDTRDLWSVFSDDFSVLKGRSVCLTKLVDKRGWVVPDATVESCRMVPQLVENLLHLKCCQYVFNQHCRLDATQWKAQLHTQSHAQE